MTVKRNKTFPKEGEKKLKDTVQKLRARNRYLEKKIKFYENEILDTYGLPLSKRAKSAMPPEKKLVVSPEMRREEARKKILQRFRESIKERKS